MVMTLKVLCDDFVKVGVPWRWLLTVDKSCGKDGGSTGDLRRRSDSRYSAWRDVVSMKLWSAGLVVVNEVSINTLSQFLVADYV
ncbi:hypothetical protein Hanom_Chr03g00183881 [Helianthus anomalus]